MLLALFGFILFLALVAVVLAMPIIALFQIRHLKQRLSDLSFEVRRLRERAPSPPPIEAAPAPVEAVLTEPEPFVEAHREPRRRPVPERGWERKREPAAAFDWSKVEAWLGVRGLGWAAVVLLIFTGGFFLKLVFDQGLIGDLGKVMIGLGIGAFLCLAGWYCHRRGQAIFCEMLTSAGIALLYLSTFATFGFYELLPQDRAATFLILLVAEAFALAALYNAPAIGVMAVVGGLLTPILLHTDVDRYRSLFMYLAILNVGAIALSLFRLWWIVTTLALVGTHALFWGWYVENYHPAKLTVCVIFQLGIFALYLGQMVLVHVWRKRPTNIEDLIRVPLLAALTAGAVYQLFDADYHRWLGSMAVGMAIVYALLAGLVNRQMIASSVGEPLLFVLLALSMAFVATVFPLQADAATTWISVGWAVQGLALWWFGLRIRTMALYGMGAVFLMLGLIRLLFVDTHDGGKMQPHTDVFIPLFNSYGLPATVVCACLLAAALLQRRTRPAPGSPDFMVMRFLGLAGVGMLWIVCSIETYDFFVVRGNLNAPGVQARLTQREKEMPRPLLEDIFRDRQLHLLLTARMWLSAVWAAYALGLLAIGLRLQNRPIRWLGLALFALTLGKVMIVDTDGLQGMYRVGAFFALSLMMAAGAWAYQKLRKVLAVEEEIQNEPAV